MIAVFVHLFDLYILILLCWFVMGICTAQFSIYRNQVKTEEKKKWKEWNKREKWTLTAFKWLCSTMHQCTNNHYFFFFISIDLSLSLTFSISLQIIMTLGLRKMFPVYAESKMIDKMEKKKRKLLRLAAFNLLICCNFCVYTTTFDAL